MMKTALVARILTTDETELYHKQNDYRVMIFMIKLKISTTFITNDNKSDLEIFHKLS